MNANVTSAPSRHGATGPHQPGPKPGGRALAGIVDIAVHVDGSSGDEARIAFAEAVAVAAGAHLTAFQAHLIADPPITAEAGSAWIVAEMFEDGRRIGEEVETRIRARLERLAVPWEIRRFDDMLGGLIQAAARVARASDVFVFGPPSDAGHPATDLVEAVLFGSGSPVLLAPSTPPASFRPRTIVVGWRDTAECSRAIAAARPFLSGADIVHLVSVLEDGSDEEHHREPAADMARHLARHGVNVEIRHLPKWQKPGEGLINEASIVGADLIVAGAYGHSRLRERIWGGVTRDLLTVCPMAVLLAR